MKMNRKLLVLAVASAGLWVGSCSSESDEPVVPSTDSPSYYRDLLKCSSEEGILAFMEFIEDPSAMSKEYVYELHVPADGGRFELSLNERASWTGDEQSVFPPFSTWHSHIRYTHQYAEGFEAGPTDGDRGYTFMFKDDIGVNESAEWQASFGYVSTGFSNIVLDIEPNETSAELNHKAGFVFTSTAVDDSSRGNIYICAEITLMIYQGVR